MDVVLIRDLFVSVCVLGLITTGTAIVLGAGRSQPRLYRVGFIVRNFSSLILALFGFFVLLVMAQDFMGVKPGFAP